MAVGQEGSDGHMRGTRKQLRSQNDQAHPPADPGRARRRAGPARAGPHHHRRRGPPAHGRLSHLPPAVRSDPQPVRTPPPRPALAGSPRHPPAPRSSVPLPQPGVPPPDLRRACRPRRGRGCAPDRAAGGPAAAGRLGHRRRGRSPPRRPARHARQPGHPAAAGVRDGAGTAPDAPGARGGRLGAAARPPLRHGARGLGTR